MRIDNSQAKLFFECPTKCHERYDNNLELIARDTESLDFGTRWHELQAARNRIQDAQHLHVTQPITIIEPRLEAEAQATFQAYLQHYGEERREVVDVERTLVVPLNDRHELAFKIDLLTRTGGALAITDYKTEKRGSSYNSPEWWAARSQVALYQWAAERFYREPIVALYLDVTTRSSPKGQEPPLFNRQRLVRTIAQRETAVRNIIWIADQIEVMQREDFFPSNTEACMNFRRKCDYWQLCHIGRTDANLRLYRPATPYLDL